MYLFFQAICKFCHAEKLYYVLGECGGHLMRWSNMFDTGCCTKAVTLHHGHMAWLILVLVMPPMWGWAGGTEMVVLEWVLGVRDTIAGMWGFVPDVGSAWCVLGVCSLM